MSATPQPGGRGRFTGRQLTTIAVAIVVAIMIPTGASAVTTITRVVLEDPGKAHTPARVTPAGALQVAEAAPASFLQTRTISLLTGTPTLIAKPPKGLALIVTTIRIDSYADPSPGSGNGVQLYILTGSKCTGNEVGTFGDDVWPGGVGEIAIPLAPGLAIPAGDSLCGNQNGSLGANATASGYTVPASAVP